MGSADLYCHRATGELYMICRADKGDLVGSAGPLDPEPIIDPETVPVTADNNAQDLILVDPVGIGNDELSEMAAYVRELSGALAEWDVCGHAAEAELPRLHETIRRLMEMSAASENENFRMLLAAIEREARRCREAIIRRLGMGN